MKLYNLFSITFFLMIGCFGRVCMAENQPQKDITWFLNNSGMKEHLVGELKDVQVYNGLRNSGGIFLVKIKLTQKQADALLKDDFFDWWFYGAIDGNVFKKTYGLLDLDSNKKITGLIPASEKCSWIYVQSASKKRFYAIESINNEYILYYFYSEI